MLLRERKGVWLFFLTAVAASLSVAGLVSCGGGAGESTQGGAGEPTDTDSPASAQMGPLKRPEFTAQANAICSHAEDERRQASTDVGEGEDSGDAAAVTEALVAPVKTMTEELGELGPPKGDAKQVKAIIAAFEAGIATLEADPAGPESATAFAEADELATAYGLTSCVI